MLRIRLHEAKIRLLCAFLRWWQVFVGRFSSCPLFAMDDLTPPLQTDRPDGTRRRLLLVEDEPSLCQFLGEVLAREYRVQTALDGEQAWAAIQQEPPDVVLSNVNMPVLDGPELVRRLRALPTTTAVPVLLLSARLYDATLQEGFASGANGWMQKPFRLPELLEALRTLSSSGGIQTAG